MGRHLLKRQAEGVAQEEVLLDLVLTIGRNCWENPRLKGTRTNNHKPICKELADKKAVSYIQLEDMKDKSSLNKNAFASLHTKKACKQGIVNCCSKFGC